LKMQLKQAIVGEQTTVPGSVTADRTTAGMPETARTSTTEGFQAKKNSKYASNSNSRDARTITNRDARIIL